MAATPTTATEPRREVGLFEPAGPDDATPDDKALARWFVPVDKLPLKLSTQPIEGKPGGRLEGIAQLQRPLADGAALPGTGIVFGDGKGQPRSVLMFLANKNLPGVVQVKRKPPNDAALESAEQIAAQPVMFVKDTLWLRIRQCGGLQRIDSSIDGTHWIPGGVDWPPHAIDWVARQIAVLPLADRLLVSNRFQLASHDPATGAVQWRAGLGGDAATGKQSWRFGPAELLDAGLVTDEGVLLAVREPVAGKNARVATLVLLDPETGRETRRWPLAACEDPAPCLGPLVPAAGGLRVFFGRGPADATRDLMLLTP